MAETRGFRALLVAQFLGAFNDNAFRAMVSLAALESVTSSRSLLIAAAGALFVLPYLLFSTYAGWLADRFSKRSVIVAAKGAEIAVAAAAWGALWSGDPRVMLGVLFLLGTQSAFFSPARQGIIPELVPERDLSRANGVMEMATFAAILAGAAGGGLLYASFGADSAVCPLILMAVALAGTAAATRLPRVPAVGSPRPFRWNLVTEVMEDIASLRGRRPLALAVAGVAWFWFLGMAFQLNVLVYARDLLGLDDRGVTWLNACVSIGIGAGAFLAGRVSGDRVELGLVPLGSIGLGLCALLLGVLPPWLPLVAAVHLMLGLSAGFFIVPLDAFIQQKAEPAERGRLIAASNFLSFAAVMMGAGWIALAGGALAWGPALVVAATGVLSIAATIYILRLLPAVFVRLLLWLATHSIYRITVAGSENVPRRGPALLVCNHISYVDGFLVGASLQRMPRFLMYRPIYEARGIHWIAKLMGCIPVSPSEGRAGTMAALRAAREQLQAGHLVCIFAEGAISRTGNLLPFRRGLEAIVHGTGAPVVPVHLDGVWGSIFSYRGGKFLWKWPRRIPYPVTVSFGAPLPGDTEAWKVRQAVMELSADAFAQRAHRQRPLHINFMATARRYPRALCMADSSGAVLTYRRALAGSLALSRALRARLAREERAGGSAAAPGNPGTDPSAGGGTVGILLPPCVPAALANVAALMAGRIVVNLNFTGSAASLQTAVERSGLRTILTSKAFLEKIGLSLDGLPARQLLMEDIAGDMTPARKALWWAATWLPGPLLRRFVHRPGIHDVATIIFSSGSTAAPKGVMLTHHNIVSNVEGMQQIFDISTSDRMMGVLPFFHSFGYTATLWLTLSTGTGVVYHPNPLDARRIGELCRKHRVSFLLATPTFLQAWLRRCTREQLASVRYVVVGAEKLKGSLASAFREAFGVEPLEGYGATELSPAATMSLPDIDEPGNRQVGHKAGSIGQPLPGVAARIVHPETLEELPVGEEGLLLIRGANVMKGYLGEPERTAEVMRGAWYITGDIARFDADGFLTLTDRLSRFAKIAGEMVPLGAVEEAIQACIAEQTATQPEGEGRRPERRPGTPIGTQPGEPPDQEGARCAVTSIPDERRGERIVVLHTLPSLDAAAVTQSLADAGLPNLWIPARDAFHHVSDIPVLGTGKMDLRAIREIAASLEKSQAAG